MKFPPHCVLAIDPGITTGWVLLDPDPKVSEYDMLATSVWGTAELKSSLDLLVRTVFSKGSTLDAIVEQVPPGIYGQLATKLEAVRREVAEVLELYEVPVTHVAPGTWKPSAVARRMDKLPWKFQGSTVTIHQKDALRMGRYAIEKRRKKA